MMTLDYNKIKSLTDEEFEKIEVDIEKVKSDPSYEKVRPETLQKVERLLDLKEGTLAHIEGYMKKQKCPNCGKSISLDDKVMTALIDAEHSKSFIAHTMLGNKRTISKTPFDRCSDCGTVSNTPKSWSFWGFVYCAF